MYLNSYKAAIEYHKKWVTPPTTPNEWNKCFLELRQAYEKTDKDPFAHDLLMCVYAEIERTCKAREKVTAERTTSAK